MHKLFAGFLVGWTLAFFIASQIKPASAIAATSVRWEYNWLTEAAALAGKQP